MQLIHRTVPNDFNIFLIGDAHLGSTLHHADGWDTMLDMVTSEYEGVDHNVVVDHGDTIEAIQTDDKRYQLGTTKESEILAQLEGAKKARTPIAENMAAILEGNHEFKYHRFGRVVEKLVAEPLNVPFGTYACVINYVDDKGQSILKQFATHGSGSIRSVADDAVRRESNMALSLKRKLKNKFGDTSLCSMGHTHLLLVCEPVPMMYLTTTKTKINQKFQAGINSGFWIPPKHKPCLCQRSLGPSPSQHRTPS